MELSKLFSKYGLGANELQNRIVMAPMTRSRAIGNITNDLMATYYSQRAGAGLIVTEGTSPSPNGLGYCRIPGLYNDSHVEGWRKVTDAVHLQGGKIFVQLMHTGRIGSVINLPAGAIVLAPSAVKASGQVWTDTDGMQDHPVPKAMTPDEIKQTIGEFEHSAKLAIEAGFDGVELHGANGYLLEQFLSPHSNQRTDEYGGSVENRCRFVLELVDVVSTAIGSGKQGSGYLPLEWQAICPITLKLKRLTLIWQNRSILKELSISILSITVQWVLPKFRSASKKRSMVNSQTH